MNRLQRRCVLLLMMAAILAATFAGCGKKSVPESEAVTEGAAHDASAEGTIIIDDNYRTTYEIFVYSFCDSDGDGIGDLNGITGKLDYIAADLGCNAIWLTPIFPSPTYHKYDALDYYSIDPQFGTLEDFDALLTACHARGIRLYMDLAVNHTSSDHPWFQEAVSAIREAVEDGSGTKDTDDDAGAYPETEDAGSSTQEDSVPEETEGEVTAQAKESGSLLERARRISPYVDWYNFSDAPQTGYAPLGDTGIYYEARFWEGMPDLNLSSDAVREEIRSITQFWQGRGVDGFRLDAVTSYYTDSRADTDEFLQWLTETVKEYDPDAYLVGEAWVDQNTYAQFYGTGIDSLFDFAFAGPDGLISSVVKGSRSAASYAEALAAEETLYTSNNPAAVNAPFYTNHDMARSAGYYAYDDGSRTKLAGALNLLMTGNAFIYYGEEIGMKGSGKDENKRAPMQWTGEAEDDGAGTCQGPPDMDSVSMKFAPLDKQMEDPVSVWYYYRDAIRLRNAFPVIARGKTTVLEELSGKTVCAFTRTVEEDRYEPVLIVINTGDEEAQIALGDTVPEFRSIAASLKVSDDAPQISGNQLTLPAFGIAVLVR